MRLGAQVTAVSCMLRMNLWLKPVWNAVATVVNRQEEASRVAAAVYAAELSDVEISHVCELISVQAANHVVLGRADGEITEIQQRHAAERAKRKALSAEHASLKKVCRTEALVLPLCCH